MKKLLHIKKTISTIICIIFILNNLVFAKQNDSLHKTNAVRVLSTFTPQEIQEEKQNLLHQYLNDFKSKEIEFNNIKNLITDFLEFTGIISVTSPLLSFANLNRKFIFIEELGINLIITNFDKEPKSQTYFEATLILPTKNNSRPTIDLKVSQQFKELKRFLIQQNAKKTLLTFYILALKEAIVKYMLEYKNKMHKFEYLQEILTQPKIKTLFFKDESEQYLKLVYAEDNGTPNNQLTFINLRDTINSNSKYSNCMTEFFTPGFDREEAVRQSQETIKELKLFTNEEQNINQRENEIELLRTIKTGTIEELEAIVNSKVDVNFLNAGKSPLHFALEQNDFRKVHLLLRNQAKVSLLLSKAYCNKSLETILNQDTSAYIEFEKELEYLKEDAISEIGEELWYCFIIEHLKKYSDTSTLSQLLYMINQIPELNQHIYSNLFLLKEFSLIKTFIELKESKQKKYYDSYESNSLTIEKIYCIGLGSLKVSQCNETTDFLVDYFIKTNRVRVNTVVINNENYIAIPFFCSMFNNVCALSKILTTYLTQDLELYLIPEQETLGYENLTSHNLDTQNRFNRTTLIILQAKIELDKAANLIKIGGKQDLQNALRFLEKTRMYKKFLKQTKMTPTDYIAANIFMDYCILKAGFLKAKIYKKHGKKIQKEKINDSIIIRLKNWSTPKRFDKFFKKNRFKILLASPTRKIHDSHPDIKPFLIGIEHFFKNLAKVAKLATKKPFLDVVVVTPDRTKSEIIDSSNNASSSINLYKAKKQLLRNKKETTLFGFSENIKILINKYLEVFNEDNIQNTINKTIKLLNSNDEYIKFRDVENNTLLHYAIIQNDTTLFKKALKYSKILLNKKNNDGYTPFLLAIKEGRFLFAKELLEQKNCDPYQIGPNGNNALHLCASHNNSTTTNIDHRKDIIETLISIGVNIYAKNNEKQTPIKIDKEHNPLFSQIDELGQIYIDKFLYAQKEGDLTAIKKFIHKHNRYLFEKCIINTNTCKIIEVFFLEINNLYEQNNTVAPDTLSEIKKLEKKYMAIFQYYVEQCGIIDFITYKENFFDNFDIQTPFSSQNFIINDAKSMYTLNILQALLSEKDFKEIRKTYFFACYSKNIMSNFFKNNEVFKIFNKLKIFEYIYNLQNNSANLNAEETLKNISTELYKNFGIKLSVEDFICKFIPFITTETLSKSFIRFLANDSNYKSTLLFNAIDNDDTEFVSALTCVEMDINILDPKGNNALHRAVEKNSRDMVQTLIECGINLTHKNNNGITPLALAKTLNKSDEEESNIEELIDEAITKVLLYTKKGNLKKFKRYVDKKNRNFTIKNSYNESILDILFEHIKETKNTSKKRDPKHVKKTNNSFHENPFMNFYFNNMDTNNATNKYRYTNILEYLVKNCGVCNIQIIENNGSYKFDNNNLINTDVLIQDCWLKNLQEKLPTETFKKIIQEVLFLEHFLPKNQNPNLFEKIAPIFKFARIYYDLKNLKTLNSADTTESIIELIQDNLQKRCKLKFSKIELISLVNPFTETTHTGLLMYIINKNIINKKFNEHNGVYTLSNNNEILNRTISLSDPWLKNLKDLFEKEACTKIIQESLLAKLLTSDPSNNLDPRELFHVFPNYHIYYQLSRLAASFDATTVETILGELDVQLNQTTEDPEEIELLTSFSAKILKMFDPTQNVNHIGIIEYIKKHYNLTNLDFIYENGKYNFKKDNSLKIKSVLSQPWLQDLEELLDEKDFINIIQETLFIEHFIYISKNPQIFRKISHIFDKAKIFYCLQDFIKNGDIHAIFELQKLLDTKYKLDLTIEQILKRFKPNTLELQKNYNNESKLLLYNTTFLHLPSTLETGNIRSTIKEFNLKGEIKAEIIFSKKVSKFIEFLYKNKKFEILNIIYTHELKKSLLSFFLEHHKKTEFLKAFKRLLQYSGINHLLPKHEIDEYLNIVLNKDSKLNIFDEALKKNPYKNVISFLGNINSHAHTTILKQMEHEIETVDITKHQIIYFDEAEEDIDESYNLMPSQDLNLALVSGKNEQVIPLLISGSKVNDILIIDPDRCFTSIIYNIDSIRDFIGEISTLNDTKVSLLIDILLAEFIKKEFDAKHFPKNRALQKYLKLNNFAVFYSLFLTKEFKFAEKLLANIGDHAIVPMFQEALSVVEHFKDLDTLKFLIDNYVKSSKVNPHTTASTAGHHTILYNSAKIGYTQGVLEILNTMAINNTPILLKHKLATANYKEKYKYIVSCKFKREIEGLILFNLALEYAQKSFKENSIKECKRYLDRCSSYINILENGSWTFNEYSAFKELQDIYLIKIQNIKINLLPKFKNVETALTPYSSKIFHASYYNKQGIIFKKISILEIVKHWDIYKKIIAKRILDSIKGTKALNNSFAIIRRKNIRDDKHFRDVVIRTQDEIIKYIIKLKSKKGHKAEKISDKIHELMQLLNQKSRLEVIIALKDPNSKLSNYLSPKKILAIIDTLKNQINNEMDMIKANKILKEAKKWTRMLKQEKTLMQSNENLNKSIKEIDKINLKNKEKKIKKYILKNLSEKTLQKFIDFIDFKGQTILHLLVINLDISTLNMQNIISDLIKIKSDILEIKDIYGNTPFLLVVKNRSVEMAKLLLDNGANIHTQDIGLNNGLHIAAFQNSEDIAELLLDRGISCIQKNNKIGNFDDGDDFSKVTPDIIADELYPDSEIPEMISKRRYLILNALKTGNLSIIKKYINAENKLIDLEILDDEQKPSEPKPLIEWLFEFIKKANVKTFKNVILFTNSEIVFESDSEDSSDNNKELPNTEFEFNFDIAPEKKNETTPLIAPRVDRVLFDNNDYDNESDSDSDDDSIEFTTDDEENENSHLEIINYLINECNLIESKYLHSIDFTFPNEKHTALIDKLKNIIPEEEFKRVIKNYMWLDYIYIKTGAVLDYNTLLKQFKTLNNIASICYLLAEIKYLFDTEDIKESLIEIQKILKNEFKISLTNDEIIKKFHLSKQTTLILKEKISIDENREKFKYNTKDGLFIELNSKTGKITLIKDDIKTQIHQRNYTYNNKTHYSLINEIIINTLFKLINKKDAKNQANILRTAYSILLSA